MADIVPSIRYAPDDPRPVGFAEEVSPAHLGSTGDALAAVAAAVNSVRAKSVETQLRIRLCSAAGSDAASKRGVGALSAERLLRLVADPVERSAVTSKVDSALALLDLGVAATDCGPVIVRQLRRAA